MFFFPSSQDMMENTQSYIRIYSICVTVASSGWTTTEERLRNTLLNNLLGVLFLSQ